jgi:hypothetical protein
MSLVTPCGQYRTITFQSYKNIKISRHYHWNILFSNATTYPLWTSCPLLLAVVEV